MNAQPQAICFIDGSNLHGHLERTFGSGKIRLPDLCRLLAGSERLGGDPLAIQKALRDEWV